jgi:hypothetical protein
MMVSNWAWCYSIPTSLRIVSLPTVPGDAELALRPACASYSELNFDLQ